MRTALAMLALWGWGCSGDDRPPPSSSEPEVLPLPAPRIDALSTDRIRVGEELVFSGAGFVNDERGYTVVTFRGRFVAEDGSVENVDMTIAPEVVSETEASWSQFGPHRVPFVPSGNRLGRFEGRVFAQNRATADGLAEPTQTDPVETSLEVLPSIVVRELQPEGAACAIVARSAINLLPYRLQVEALGFEPARFRYVFSPGAITDAATLQGSPDEIFFEHEAAGRIDALAEHERPRFAEVPFGLQAYRASVSITAEEADGTAHTLQVRLTVRRPLEVDFLAAVTPAQLYEPVPVSGCIPGGRNGREVNYSESHSEVRERSFEVGWAHEWESQYTRTNSNSYERGQTDTNRIGFESSDGQNWNWNVNGEVYGEGGVSLVAEGKAGFKVGAGTGGGGTHETTSTGDQEWEHSRTYGQALEESNATREAEQESGGQTWTVSSEDSQALAFTAFLLPNQFGTFYRQTTRLVRMGQVVAYDLCGLSVPVGDITLDDYTWAPELAMGDGCPPFPVSAFPEAQCLEPPCDE